MAQNADASQKSFLDRALSVVSRVEPGEGLLALLLAIDVFLLLTSYYLIKPVREALILSDSGAEIKSYSSIGQIALLFVTVPVYSALARRLDRIRLITWVTTFFLACLGLFYALLNMKTPGLGIAFYLWVGIFNLVVVAQFWSYASDIYDKETGERLFPILGLGASLGAVFGSHIASALAVPFGVPQLLLVSAVLLGASLVLVRWIDARAAPLDQPQESPSEDDPGPSGVSRAFTLVLSNRYLLLLAGLTLLTNIVNTTGEYILGRVVTEAAERQGSDAAARDWIGQFYGTFYFWVNVVGTVTQVFLVSRFVRWFGVSGTLLILPIIALGSYGLLVVTSTLAVVRWAKTAENSTNYSLQNTIRNALFLPLNRAEKYEAKQAIDTLFVRGGDVLSAGIVFLGNEVFRMAVGGFALVNLGFAALWLVVALLIGARYRALHKNEAPSSQ